MGKKAYIKTGKRVSRPEQATMSSNFKAIFVRGAIKKTGVSILQQGEYIAT